MANYFDTGILLTAGFSLSSQAPLDGRSVVELLTDLDTHIAENRAYEGMEVYVKENKKIYIFNGTTWEEFVGGGSSEEQIKDWVSGSSYLDGDYIYHEGEIYRCLTSNSDVDFDETNWEQVTYGIDELSKEDVERLLGLTEEEIEAMEGLILDTEVRIDKTYSSSKIYTDIQQCLEDSKTYTLEEIAKIGTASYKIVTDVADMTEERYLYLLHDGATNYDIYVVEADGTPAKIGSTQIDLSSYYTKEEVDELLEANAVDLSGYAKTFTSLSQLGLTEPVSVGEIFNAMPNKTIAILACEAKDEDGGTVSISDIPTAFGVLTIKKNEKGRFSIEYQNSLQGSSCDVKRWIGTLKGLDGTGLYWKQLSAEPTFVALTDIGLTADATFQDVIDTLPKGGSALLGVKDFANYQTIFPYEEENDQFARVHISKGVADGSCMYARWFRKDGVKEAIAVFNINDNKFGGWRILKNQQVYTSLKELELDTTATINDIIGAMKNGTTFTYKTDVFDYATEYNNIQLGTVTINKQSAPRVQALMTDKSTGNLYVGKLDGNNQIVGWTKVITEYSDPYVCTSYKALTGTEDLFTLPCGHYVSANINTTYNYPITDSDKATAHIYVLGCLNDSANNKGYRIILYFDNKNRMYRINEWWGSFANGWQKIQDTNGEVITSNTIAKYGTEILKYPVGVWRIDSVNLGKQFADLPIAEMAGVIEIDSIYPNKSPYEHAYGYRNYTFRDALTANVYVRTLNSGDTAGTLQRDTGWKKVCTDETRLTTVETRVNELFQSVSSGKTLVANAITGKGVSTATDATFATMATNISKISGGYKEETKSLIVTSNSTGTQTLTFTFSANVIAVKQIVAPSDSCRIVPQTSKDMLTINGKELIVYVTGTGTWKATALVRSS